MANSRGTALLDDVLRVDNACSMVRIFVLLRASGVVVSRISRVYDKLVIVLLRKELAERNHLSF